MNHLALRLPVFSLYSWVRKRLKPDNLWWSSSVLSVSWLSPMWCLDVRVRLKMICFFQSFGGSLSAVLQPVGESPMAEKLWANNLLLSLPVSLLMAWVSPGSLCSVHMGVGWEQCLLYLLMLMATITGCHPDFRTSAREGLCLAIATQRGIMTMKTAQIRGERYFTSGKEKKSWIKCP